MARIDKPKTESIRIETEQADRVRRFVAAKPYTLGGYVSELIRKDMDRLDKREQAKANKQ